MILERLLISAGYDKPERLVRPDSSESRGAKFVLSKGGIYIPYGTAIWGIYRMGKLVRGYTGRFVPKNASKYLGDPTNIIYRSLWERRVMVYLDEEPSVLK